MTQPRSEQGSPFGVALWMGAGAALLYLLAMSQKKTPIDTVQGLPPYEPPPPNP